MKRPLILAIAVMTMSPVIAQHKAVSKPRVIISTDIGGTDPDDNQSMAHLLMYSDMFDLEGLVSSPSYGNGSKAEILRMIDIYAKDYPKLRRHAKVMSPRKLRRLCKEGRHGLLPWCGYSEPAEGSRWIVRCARQKSDRPLWVLVWGSLDDLAQALHDAPDIAPSIRVYYIGGPNKKWGANSHHYIAQNFPDLWMIENNSTYRAIISNKKVNDDYNAGYYDHRIKGCGALGADFINYYEGMPKMGDTPSLLYVMDGDPDDPTGESWGGSFEPTDRTSRRVMYHPTTTCDTIPVFGIAELYFTGPVLDVPQDSACFKATINRQVWDGYCVSPGVYALRYSSYVTGPLDYVTQSTIKELDGLCGQFVVGDSWPGTASSTDYRHGAHWYTDRQDPSLFDGKHQGAKTIMRHRADIYDDWARRWSWLK